MSAGRLARAAGIAAQAASVLLGAACAGVAPDGAPPAAGELEAPALGAQGIDVIEPPFEIEPSLETPASPLLACVACAPLPSPDPFILADRWGQQGTVLHGIMDAPTCVAQEVPRSFLRAGVTDAAGKPIDDVRVENGRLVHGEGDSSDVWTNARLQVRLGCAEGADPLAVEARITKVVTNELDPEYMQYSPELTQYRIMLVDPLTGDQFPACRSLDNREEGELAIVVPGVWNEQGVLEDDPDAFSFACNTTAVAKCTGWGYRAWDQSTLPGRAQDKRLLESCTRMARADYCGDGVSWTQDGTTIHLWDSLTTGPNYKMPPYPGFMFEAAWEPEGAVCFDHPRISKKYPSCHNELPSCASVAEAGGMASDPLLVFNASLP